MGIARQSATWWHADCCRALCVCRGLPPQLTGPGRCISERLIYHLSVCCIGKFYTADSVLRSTPAHLHPDRVACHKMKTVVATRCGLYVGNASCHLDCSLCCALHERCQCWYLIHAAAQHRAAHVHASGIIPLQARCTSCYRAACQLWPAREGHAESDVGWRDAPGVGPTHAGLGWIHMVQQLQAEAQLLVQAQLLAVPAGEGSDVGVARHNLGIV